MQYWNIPIKHDPSTLQKNSLSMQDWNILKQLQCRIIYSNLALRTSDMMTFVVGAMLEHAKFAQCKIGMFETCTCSRLNNQIYIYIIVKRQLNYLQPIFFASYLSMLKSTFDSDATNTKKDIHYKY